jgi:hypothetical protein
LRKDDSTPDESSGRRGTLRQGRRGIGRSAEREEQRRDGDRVVPGEAKDL